MIKFFRLFLHSLLLVILAGAAKPFQVLSTPWQTKVDLWVLESVEAGQAEFLVFLKEQADLSEAGRLQTKLEKGTFVYQRLTETARRTQGPVLAALQDLSSRAPGKVEYRSYWVANMIWVRAGSEVVQALAQRADVAHLYANPRIRMEQPQITPEANAPEEPQGIEWNVQQVSAPAVWARGFTGQGVVIGGQDTGYDWQHPALKGKYRGWDGASADHNHNWYDAIHSGGGICGPNSPMPCDDGYHGTHTMGTMVGDDGGSNQIGVAPGARWIGCRNMDQDHGTPATYSECYQWFIAPSDLNDLELDPRPELAPDVINNSWKFPPSEGCNPSSLQTAVENVRAAGILTAHSAGNEGVQGCYSVQYPAAIYDASFTVGATDIFDNIAGFSSRGPVSVDGSYRMKPDVSAPGSGVRSSQPTRFSLYGTHSGTSMAAPHVAGLVALLLSARPDLAGQVDQIEEIIAHSAVPRTTSQICGGVPGSQVPNNTYGWGRVDAWRALQSMPQTLEISKQASDRTYDPGQFITYTLQVAYTYPLTPTYNVVVTDSIPSLTSFITATLPHTRTGDTITWEFPTLSSNQPLDLKLVVRVSESASSTIYNQDYSASSDEIAPVSGPPVPIYRAIYWYFPWVQHNIHSR